MHKLNFSEKERAMIKAISPHWDSIIEKYGDNFSATEPSILECVASEAFAFNRTGPAVESLRRIMVAFKYEGKVYRLTPEYEALIEL